MSNYNNLKTSIDANIKQNGNQEITGPILNSVLNQMVNILGTGYQFAGIATLDPATEPGTPDAKVFYIANGKGTYTNFGGLEVTEDEVVVLYWDSAWHKDATGIASQAKLSELEGKVIDIELDVFGPKPIKFQKGYNINSTDGHVFAASGYSVSPVLNYRNEEFALMRDGYETKSIGWGFMAYYDETMSLLGVVRRTIDDTLLAQSSFIQFSYNSEDDAELDGFAIHKRNSIKKTSVSIHEQIFTLSEQKQARANINAASMDDIAHIGIEASSINVTENIIDMSIGQKDQDRIDTSTGDTGGYFIRLVKGMPIKITGSILNAYMFNQRPYVGLLFEGARGRRLFANNLYFADAGEEYLFITFRREEQVTLELSATGIYKERLSSAIQNYRYLAFSFIESQKGMKILGSNDLSRFNLLTNALTEFVPAANAGVRDPAIIQIDGWYYIAYTPALGTVIENQIGLCKTRDFDTYEELPNPILVGQDGEDFTNGYCWAPDWFREGDNIYLVVGCATSAAQQDFYHYVFDFDVITNSVGQGYKLNIPFIDGHIYKQNGSYYLLRSGFQLWKSSSLKSKDWVNITSYGKPHYEGQFVIRKDDGTLRIFAQAVPNASAGVDNQHLWYCDGGDALESDFGDMVENSGLKRVTFDKSTEDYAHELSQKTDREFWHWTIFDRNNYLDNNNHYQ